MIFITFTEAFLTISTMTRSRLYYTGVGETRRLTLGLSEGNKVNMIWVREWQMSPIKDQTVNISGFACHK